MKSELSARLGIFAIFLLLTTSVFTGCSAGENKSSQEYEHNLHQSSDVLNPTSSINAPISILLD